GLFQCRHSECYFLGSLDFHNAKIGKNPLRAKRVRQECPTRTLLAIYTHRMGIHPRPHSAATPTSFPFPLPFQQRNTESGQGFGRKKPHSEAAQDFFRSELAQPLTAPECGVTFAAEREKNNRRLQGMGWNYTQFAR
ncbi:hypothetical protein ABG839_25125, partial [Phocaeicola vulgatus]